MNQSIIHIHSLSCCRITSVFQQPPSAGGVSDPDLQGQGGNMKVCWLDWNQQPSTSSPADTPPGRHGDRQFAQRFSGSIIIIIIMSVFGSNFWSDLIYSCFQDLIYHSGIFIWFFFNISKYYRIIILLFLLLLFYWIVIFLLLLLLLMFYFLLLLSLYFNIFTLLLNNIVTFIKINVIIIIIIDKVK